MGQLFKDAELTELPAGIVDEKLNNVEAIVLKLLVFINEPMTKTDMKHVVSIILTSVAEYSNFRMTIIYKSIDSLEGKDILIRTVRGISVDPEVVSKILPLAKDNKPLLKKAVAYFKKNRFYRYNNTGLHLAIMANDFSSLDEIAHVTQLHSWSNVAEKIRGGLLKTGNLALINPLLKRFHEDHKKSFLDSLPFSLHYDDFKQLKNIYLDPIVKPGRSAKYIYASCAYLILPVNEVIKIIKALNLDSDCLFFSKLLKGDMEGALDQGASFLSTIQQVEGHKRKELPGVFGFLYALVLVASGDSKNLILAATFIRSAMKFMPRMRDLSNPFISFSKVVLLFINHKIGKKTTSANEICETYEATFHQHFLTAVLNWFGKPMTDTSYPDIVSEDEEFEYRASGLKRKEDSEAYCKERLAALRAKLDYLPLAEIYKPDELWEDVLSVLANELSKNKTGDDDEKKAAKKRLIWLVDPMVENRLMCLEQTRNKNGWTKGKSRSLGRLMSTRPDFVTKEDNQVIACFEKHYYHNDVYIRNWNKLLKILAIHPEVYTISEPHLPLSIRMQEARIQIDKNKRGATIKLIPKSPQKRVEKETPTSYIYTHWSKQAMRVYNILSNSNLKEIVIPQSGMAKAKPVIDRLNEVMPVAGNFTHNGAEKKKSANIPVFQLTPVNDQLHVQLLIEVLKDEEARYVPGIGSSEVLVNTAKGQAFSVVRDRPLEKEILMDLADRIDWLQEMKSSSAQLFIDEDESILDFLADVKEHAPEVKMVWPKGERLRVAKVLSPADFNINIKQSQDWFAVEGEVVVDDSLKLTIQQLLDKSKGGTLKYVQLDDKTYLSICADLQKRLAVLDVVAHPKGKKLMVHPLGSGSVEKFTEGVENVKTDKRWKQHLENLEQLKSYKAGLPDNLKAELRPYQEEGVLWLDRLYHWGVGACLADDMGLGKTIQGISILLRYAKNGPSLVLAPASVCNNWIKELIRFAPTLNPVELKNHNREDVLNSLKAFDVLVMSYGLLQANPDLLDKREWNTVILDEAHAIKNAKTVRSKAVMKLNAKFKIITTGTPIQNHLGELWNLFQFINPGMLGSSDQFSKKFARNDNTSDSRQTRRSLNKYIAPFILRRNKNDVLDDLPEKTEITLEVSLSEQERAMYEVLRQEAIEHISGNNEQGGSKHLQILAEITKLRQMSCHPQLVMPGCDIPSSKLEALEKLVDDLIGANHKALVFSQFTKHLGLIRTMLDKKGISYQYLDGSTPVKKREMAIDNFQSGKSDLFLISLKAGGVGLNLTAADYVIHMDPWWNPAVEDQASDRAHRIGQQRPVTIYRIIAENTIEEKIVKMHHSKRDLADKLLANTDQSAKISSEELMDLITENY
ncbi:DEAD/DEAH box helicase [Marinilabiliaceae bacterium JC017]|nr:DEAD/DEAH box helicase [Marinilabiliaceae bacterium JC017]